MDIKNILNKTGNGIKKVSMEIFWFLSSKVFLKSFFILIGLFAAILFLTSWWMKCYTNHGESLQVHDYLGLSLEEAQYKAKGRSFKIVVSDSQYIVGKPAYEILEQNPKPLSRVKEDRKIYVRINRAIAPEVKLPGIRSGNDDFNQYRRKLSILDIDAKIIDRKFSNKLEPNTILKVIYEGEDITEKLRDGFSVPKGKTLEFVVTERGGGRVPVPQLICKKYDAGVFLIGNFNLNVGSVIEDATVTDKYTAYIWKQRPQNGGGRTLRVGEQVDIYLTQYPPDNCPEDDMDQFDLEDSDLTNDPDNIEQD